MRDIRHIIVSHKTSRSLVHSGVHALLVLAVLILVVPAAVRSLTVALICLSTAAISILALIIGLARAGSAFLIVGFGTVPLNDLHPIGFLSFLELSDVFFGAGFLLLAPRLIGNTLRIPTAFLIGAAGLLTVGALSAVVGDQPGFDLHYVMLLSLSMVLLPVLLVWWQPGRRSAIAAAAAYMGGNAINVVNSLVGGPDETGRSAGLATHPNIMGACQLFSLALVPFLLRALPRRYAWIVIIGSIVSAYGIWISGSRAALAVAVGVTVTYPLFRRSALAALGVAALCLPGIVVVDRESKSPDSSNALGRLLGGGGSGSSNDAREAGFRDGFDRFLAHPLLGDGWDSIWGAHNAYLQIAAAIGLFGLIFYGMMLQPIMRPIIAVPPPYGLLALPALAAVMISVVDPALGSRYIWSVAALALCADRLAARSEEPSGKIHDSVAHQRA